MNMMNGIMIILAIANYMIVSVSINKRKEKQNDQVMMKVEKAIVT